MRAIQEKISIAATFCTIIEVTIRCGHPERAQEMLSKLRSTIEGLTVHVDSTAQVCGKRARQFQQQLAQLTNRLAALESKNASRSTKAGKM